MLDFLVKVVTVYIKIHYEKSKNVNFLALIRSYVLLAQTRYCEICYYKTYTIFGSEFVNNTSLEDNEDTSAVAAFRFPTVFWGRNYFIRNRGGGITLLNTRMQANGTLLFDSNVAVFGAGIAMDDRCLVNLLFPSLPPSLSFS